jgi:hypothetical protein
VRSFGPTCDAGLKARLFYRALLRRAGSFRNYPL